MTDLADKVAFVTGAASGIGLGGSAMAIQLHHEGAKDTKLYEDSSRSFVVFVPSWWNLLAARRP